MQKKHKILIICTCIILLLGIGITSIAIVGGKKPEVVSGGYKSRIVDRLDITVENTDFTLKKSKENAEQFTLTLYFSAKKTQADFYAVINSFTLSDIAYDNIVFTALNEETQGKTLDSLALPAKDGEPQLMKWQVDITLSVVGKGTYSPNILIDYTSGINEGSSQNKLLEIPLTITVE